jgi:hypothetical protein
MTLLSAAALTLAAPADTAALTQLRLVIDSAMFAEIGGSTYLPRAYGAGFLGGPAEVRLCGRLTCVVFVPADTLRGIRAGDVTIGVQPVAGSALAERLVDSTHPRAGVTIVARPARAEPPPSGEDLPPVHYLESAVLAVPLEAMPQLDAALRSAGAEVFPEGQGLVVRFTYQTLRLVPAFAGAGAERLAFRLRREVAGDPTFRFGTMSRLRFGPGRVASWTF